MLGTVAVALVAAFVGFLAGLVMGGAEYERAVTEIAMLRVKLWKHGIDPDAENVDTRKRI